jgi:hypothetical protein
MKKLLMLTLLMGLLVGCDALKKDPYGELRMSQEVFIGAVNTLVDLRTAGQIGDDEWPVVKKMAHSGEQYLLDWAAAIRAGEDDAKAKAAWYGVMRFLQPYLILKENDND